ncbi:MAG: hypothetical protein AAGI24_10815 [Pseudomonadota bacterium]
MKQTIALLAVLASGSAFGACDNARIPAVPAIPDGVDASYEEMQGAREAVAEYVESAEAFLDCVQPIPMMHNYVVERIERTANEFNAEREVFLQQQDAVAAN